MICLKDLQPGDLIIMKRHPQVRSKLVLAVCKPPDGHAHEGSKYDYVFNHTTGTKIYPWRFMVLGGSRVEAFFWNSHDLNCPAEDYDYKILRNGKVIVE